MILLEGGGSIRYDALSVAIGSAVSEDGLQAADSAIPVKPIENVIGLRDKLRNLEKNSLLGYKPEVLIVGGGAAGCEVACNAKRAFEEHGINGLITIADRGDALLGSTPGRAQTEIHEYLRSRGVKVLLGSEIIKVEERAAYTRDGRRIGFDVAILAVGIRPTKMFGQSGLTTGGDGGLWVNRYLQSISDPHIFGGGDAISYRGESLEKLGVFAIRQGPVLFHNLQAYLKGEPLKEFEPQKVFLYILNLGDETGLAIYGPLVWRSRLAWRLKSYIDTKFVREHQYP